MSMLSMLFNKLSSLGSLGRSLATPYKSGRLL